MEPTDNKPVMDIPNYQWAQYSQHEWYMWEPGCEYLVTQSIKGWTWTAQTMTTPSETVLTANQFKPKDWPGFDSATGAIIHCHYIRREMRDTTGT